MEIFKRLLLTRTVQNRYARAGLDVGDAVSYLYGGEIVGLEEQVERWRSWEAEYSRRGYRTISLEKFIAAGYSVEPLRDSLGKQREPQEAPILHAERFIRKYRGRERTEAIDLEAHANEDRTFAYGNFTLPTTEEETDTKQSQ